MEHRYIYSWFLRPRRGLEVELRIEAPSAVVARREIAVFLQDHDGLAWTLDGVRRWVAPGEERGGITYVGPGEFARL